MTTKRDARMALPDSTVGPGHHRPQLLKQFNDMTIGAKLNSGFGLLVLLMLVVVALIFAASRAATRDISLTRNVRTPAALASARAQSSLLTMQASVRGYLALGDLQYIDDYNKASADFTQNLAQLKTLSADWTNPDDVRRLRQLEETYATWAPIPHTLFVLHDNPMENQPALRVENAEFRPAANRWAAELEALIKSQEARPNTAADRALLSDMVDLQTSFQAMVTNLRAYAITGDAGFKYGYSDSLVANSHELSSIVARRDLLSAPQQASLDALVDERARLLEVPLRIFTLREGERSVEDLYLFRTETEPLAGTMLTMLDEITTAQRAYLRAELDNSRLSLVRMQIQTLVGGLVALLLGALMAFFFRDMIAGPVERLDDTAKRIRDGDLTAQALAESEDEIGRLALTFNSMTSRLRDTIGRLEQLYAMSRGIMSAGTLSELIGVMVQGGQVPVINRAVLNLFEYDAADAVTAMVVQANWYGGTGIRPSPPGTRYPRAVTPIVEHFLTLEPVVFDNIQTDARTDPATAEIARQLGICAMVVLPLWSQARQQGVLLLEGDAPYHFQDDDVAPYLSMLGQLTIAIENRRLFEETEQRARELARAKEAAEAASRAKSDFLANVSHELRTPLNGILGYAQILRRNPPQVPARTRAADIIYDNGIHLLALIDDILDLSKIEARKLTLQPAWFSFSHFLNGMAEIFRLRVAESSAVEFRMQLLTPLPAQVWGDEKRLRQICMNLLSNAVKFTSAGHVHFRIAAAHTDGNHGSDGELARLTFEVEDTGIGMSADQLERIFLPFEQVGDLGMQAQGTGLGLAIAKDLVASMTGELAVRSEQGVGSLFAVALELPAAWASEALPPAPADNAATVVSALAQSKTPPSPTVPVTLPAREELNTLLDLAMKGELRRLAALAQEIEAQDPAAGEFCRQLRTLADAFDEEAIRQYLLHALER